MDSKYRVIVENWNKFLNEDLETGTVHAEAYIDRLQKIFKQLRMVADKPTSKKRVIMKPNIPVDPGEGWEKIKSKMVSLFPDDGLDDRSPGQWVTSRGEEIHRLVKTGISSGIARELGADHADFEPRLKELADELIAIGDIDPTPEELEAQVFQLLPEIGSLGRLSSKIRYKLEYPYARENE